MYLVSNSLGESSAFAYDGEDKHNWSDDDKLLSMVFYGSGGGVIGERNGYGDDGLRKWSVQTGWPGVSGGIPGFDDTPVAGPTVYFIYSGDTLIGEIDSAGVPIAAYTWGPNGLISEHRFAVTADQAPYASSDESLWYQFGPQGETLRRRLDNGLSRGRDSGRHAVKWG